MNLKIYPKINQKTTKNLSKIDQKMVSKSIQNRARGDASWRRSAAIEIDRFRIDFDPRKCEDLCSGCQGFEK